MGKETVELQILTNAKMVLGELRLMNAELHNIKSNMATMNATSAKGTAGARAHNLAIKEQASSMKGLALRFVGYNLVLTQVMGAQQKLMEFIKESVTAFREFETRIAEISTILGSEHMPLIERLASGIENLSMAYGQATSDMSKGMYDILSAAFEAGDALNLLTTSTKASIAGLSDIRTSVDIFTTVLNTYGLQVEQATNVSNILFQSVIRGKFQFQDLEQALGYVVPIAAQAGIQFEELMGALSTATRHGLHLDMTSRGLALAIQGIVNPSVKATKAAQKYGIEMNGLALRVMGLYGWFEKLNEATKEYGKSILGELVPNMRSLRVAMVLAGDVGLAGFNQDLIELAKMGNATEIALRKIMDTSQFVSSQLTQQWEKVKREVGADWDEVVLGVQSAIIGVVQYMQYRGRLTQLSTTAAKGDYEFLKEDALHNATEYLKISEEIVALEEERKLLPPDPAESGMLEKIVRFIGEPFLVETKKTPVKDINEQIMELTGTQELFVDSFNEVVGGILTEIDALGDLDLTLDNVVLSIRELDDELLKTFVYGFKDASGAMKEASIDIDTLTTLTEKQREALKKLGSTIQGNLAYQYLALHAQREYADATHDVSTGLKIADHVYKEIPANIQAAVSAVREHTKAQNDNREATQRMTAAMRIYQIQLLEIQLKGMLRRRGLTRMEERQIKKIQIAQAKARLENMKGQKEMGEVDVTVYQQSQALIDDYLFKIKEKQYELKYTYDQQIIDLETSISREGEKLQTRYDWWETTNQKIIDNSQSLISTLNGILEEDIFVDMLEDYGLKVDDLKAKIADLMGVAEGRTGTYTEPTAPPELPPPMSQESAQKVLQRMYERLPAPIQNILQSKFDFNQFPPRGETAVGAVRIGNVIIDVKSISDIDTVEKLAAALAQAESSGVMENGKTKFRLRMG